VLLVTKHLLAVHSVLEAWQAPTGVGQTPLVWATLPAHVKHKPSPLQVAQWLETPQHISPMNSKPA